MPGFRNILDESDGAALHEIVNAEGSRGGNAAACGVRRSPAASQKQAAIGARGNANGVGKITAVMLSALLSVLA